MSSNSTSGSMLQGIEDSAWREYLYTNVHKALIIIAKNSNNSRDEWITRIYRKKNQCLRIFVYEYICVYIHQHIYVYTHIHIYTHAYISLNRKGYAVAEWGILRKLC